MCILHPGSFYGTTLESPSCLAPPPGSGASCGAQGQFILRSWPPTLRFPFLASSHNPFKHLHLRFFLDRARNHVVIWRLILTHHSRHSPLQSHHCVPRSKPRPACSAPANHHKISVIPFVLIFFRTLLH